MNFDTLTFRSSALGNIMTEPKVVTKEKYKENLEEIKSLYENPTPSTSKVFLEKEAKRKAKIDSLIQECIRLRPLLSIPSLSQTCKSYLIKIYIEQTTGRRDEIDSRYLKKGTQSEDNSMSILSDYDDTLHFKNDRRLYNDFIQGECDIEEDERITDIKSSWDIFTFYPHAIESELTDMYWWQGQGYMWLFSKSRFRLVYVLTDTPTGLIEDEKKRLLWKIGTNKAGTEEYRMGCEEIEHNSKYSDLTTKERVIIMPEISIDHDAIERLKVRVNDCRLWLNWYHERIQNRINGVVLNTTTATSVDILAEAGVNSEYQKKYQEETTITSEVTSSEIISESQTVSVVNADGEMSDGNKFEMPVVKEKITSDIITELTNGDIIIDVTTIKSEKETTSFEIESQSPVLPNVEKVIQVDLVDSIAEIKGITEDEAYDMIGRCKTVEDCVQLRDKIKHLPSCIEVLRAKKNKLANPTATAEPPKKKIEEKKNQSYYDTLSTLTKSADVLDFYQSNAEVIDADPDLMKACEKRGIELERMEAKNDEL